ncbi:hypothetical protein CY34DRAFT_100311, partial [Suillus luteus UH-Slu-Lm8-n1]
MPGGPSIKRTTRSAITTLTSTEIEALPSTVSDAVSAHKYLTKKNLCFETEPYTLTHLTSILLQITQISGSIPLPVTTAIRAAVFLLKQHVADEITETVSKQITETVTKQITEAVTVKLVDHVVAAIAPQVAKILTASESLAETTKLQHQIGERIDLDRDINAATERITNATDTLSSSIDDCRNAFNLLSPSLDATQDRINSLSNQFNSQIINS